jgi:hypothetical protein
MNDHDDFFERLSRDARPLRFEPDAAMPARIAARVRGRIAVPASPTVYQFLATWVRPMAASFAAVVLTAFLGFAWTTQQDAAPQQPTIDTMSASSQIEIGMAGEQFGVSH